MEQHDDHIWVTVSGEGWAIRSIQRDDPKGIILHLWRGYYPELSYCSIQFISPDWKSYCEAAVEMINQEYGKEYG